MLALHPQRAAAKTPHEQTALDRQIAATDKLIDAEVYALYGLTAEEIAIVEGRAADPAAPAASGGTAASSAAAAHHHHVFLREDPAEYPVNPNP
jgi:hypothetical protein